VEILLSAGMYVNVHTPAGTALHEAALCGKIDVVRTLLDAGVDIHARDSKHNMVTDLLSLFPKHAHVAHEIDATIRRKLDLFFRFTVLGDSVNPVAPDWSSFLLSLIYVV